MKKQQLLDDYEYEFGGPIGAVCNIITLPFITLLLTYWASIGHVDFEQIFPDDSICTSDGRISSYILSKFVQSNVLCPSCKKHETLIMCAMVVLAWFLFQVALERFLPCLVVEGAPLPDGSGKRLTYRINGHLAFWVTLLLRTCKAFACYQTYVCQPHHI